MASAVEVDDVAPVAPAVEADEEIVASAVEADEVVVAPAVEADEVVEPESVLDETPEVAATDHPQVAWSDAPTGPSTDESPADGGHAVIPEPSIPAPDSPFAEILDREAPMPAWASAPEPTDQVVDRAAMERSVPATLLPEAADLD